VTGDSNDIIVRMGDMSKITLTSININFDAAPGTPEHTLAENYTDMANDYIEDFNQMVMQGQSPHLALMAIMQAATTLLGVAIRQGLDVQISRRLLSSMLRQSEAASKKVVLVSGH
jgi:hypothetical protein